MFNMLHNVGAQDCIHYEASHFHIVRMRYSNYQQAFKATTIICTLFIYTDVFRILETDLVYVRMRNLQLSSRCYMQKYLIFVLIIFQ